MKINMNKFVAFAACLLVLGASAHNGSALLSHGAVADTDSDSVATSRIPESSVVDEVIWVVGDEPILKSDVEAMRLQSEAEGVKWHGNPDCAIPEQLAIQKLFLHQAALDSIEVTESEVSQSINEQLDYLTQMIGSQEKLEEYYKKSLSQMRDEMHDDFKNRLLIQRMKEKLVEDVKVSPADVKAYFRNMPQDSIPLVPTEVEVEILVNTPKVPQAEINKVKDDLRSYTDRINKGETTFSTMARFYSEDTNSARHGGELGYVSRAMLDPAFAQVAFSLTDPKKISKIVESEFGYHIIQLIDKRGDEINVRHILRIPVVPQEEIDKSLLRLDSIRGDITSNKFTFEQAAAVLSDDKDTKMNHGLMTNVVDGNQRTSKFKMKDLPTEVAQHIDTMKVGEVSAPFVMVNKRNKKVTAMVKLLSRIDGHKATITEDFQVMKDLVTAKKKEEVINNWIDEKIKHTYVKMNDRYKNCDFEHKGWIK